MININEVIETNKMIDKENLDVRTITLGISLLDCIDSDLTKLCDNVYKKITTMAKDLVATGVNFIGGYTALVSKKMTQADKNLILSIPKALATTEYICS